MSNYDAPPPAQVPHAPSGNGMGGTPNTHENHAAGVPNAIGSGFVSPADNSIGNKSARQASAERDNPNGGGNMSWPGTGGAANSSSGVR